MKPEFEDAYLPQEQLLRKILGDYKSFTLDLLQRLADAGIGVQDYPIDHVCFKVSSIKNYHIMLVLLTPHIQGICETVHHGRPFAKLLLSNPLQVDKYTIPVIEIPAPKEGEETKDGLDHIEMVVGDNYQSLHQAHNSL
jgi:predicted metalloenzyme YecM